MSEYPFLLNPSTAPVSFTSDGSTAATHPLWTAPVTGQAPRMMQVIVRNPLNNPIFYIKVGSTSGIAATSSNHPIDPGSIQTFSVNEANNYFSALSASGSATMTVTPSVGD